MVGGENTIWNTIQGYNYQFFCQIAARSYSLEGRRRPIDVRLPSISAHAAH